MNPSVHSSRITPISDVEPSLGRYAYADHNLWRDALPPMGLDGHFLSFIVIVVQPRDDQSDHWDQPAELRKSPNGGHGKARTGGRGSELLRAPSDRGG